MMKTFWVLLTTILVVTATSPIENHHEAHNHLTNQHHKHHVEHVNHNLQHNQQHANIDPIDNSNEPIKTEKKEKRGLFNLYNQRPQAHIRQYATHPASTRYIVGYGPIKSSQRLLPIIRSIVPALQYKPAVPNVPVAFVSKPQVNILRPPTPVHVNAIRQQIQVHSSPQPIHRPVVQQVYQTIKDPSPPTNHYLPPQRPVHPPEQVPPHHHVKPGIQAPVRPVEEPIHPIHTPVQFPEKPIVQVAPRVPTHIVPAQHPFVEPPHAITPVAQPGTQVIYPVHTHILKPSVASIVPVQTPILKPSIGTIVPFQTPILKPVLPLQPNPPVVISSISPGVATHHYKPIVPAQVPALPVQPFIQNVHPLNAGIPTLPNQFIQPVGPFVLNTAFNGPIPAPLPITPNVIKPVVGNIPISPAPVNPLLFKHPNFVFPSGNGGVFPFNTNIIKPGHSVQTSYSATFPRHPFIQNNFPVVPNIAHSQFPFASPPLLPQPIAPLPIAPQPIAPQPIAPQPIFPPPVAPQPILPQPIIPQIIPQTIVPQAILPQPPLTHSINYPHPSITLQTPFIKNNHFIQAPFKH